jgi:hypothetical protein
MIKEKYNWTWSLEAVGRRTATLLRVNWHLGFAAFGGSPVHLLGRQLTRREFLLRIYSSMTSLSINCDGLTLSRDCRKVVSTFEAIYSSINKESQAPYHMYLVYLSSTFYESIGQPNHFRKSI